MKDFEIRLSKAVSLCEGRYSDSRFSKIYSFTTENVSDYLKYFDLKGKSLLTVGSSGDQVLNAYYNGCRDITLIDINEFAKFYIYLKISAILTLSYEEFKLFFFVHGTKEYYNKSLFSKTFFNKLKPTLRLLDYESYLFFDELFNLFDGKTIKENLIEFDEVRNIVICGFNSYLKDENAYNNFKKHLHSISFSYINQDIFEGDIQKKYDNIFLSNISCCYDILKFKGLLDKLIRNNLNEQGKVLISYLWNINYNETFFDESWNHMYNMLFVKQVLGQYIKEHYMIKDSHSIIWEEDKRRDLVLVYKS